MRHTSVGRRVFNVVIEGVPVLQSFDILSEATRDAALVKTFNVNVTDGVVDIDFTRGGVDMPDINGIEVVPN